MRMVAAAVMRTPITRMRLRVEFVADADDRAMGLKDIDELERIADSAILVSVPSLFITKQRGRPPRRARACWLACACSSQTLRA